MVRSQAQRRVVAWMAFVALWLTIVAPVISRLLPTAHDAMPAMSDMVMPDMAMSDMAFVEHIGHPAHPSMPDPLAPATDKCGYCTLVGQSPVVIAALWVPVLLPRTPYLPPALPDARAARGHTWLAPTPRGPPGFVNA